MSFAIATSKGMGMGEAGGNGAGTDDILIETRGAACLVTFNRPASANAITTAMRASLKATYPRLARDPETYCAVVKAAQGSRAFSAGGDVRELVGWHRDEPGKARAAFAEEYRLCWLHECFSKPTIALIDGAVMGSGVGLTLYGTHRVAGAGYRFAMPETAIGLFPDCGLAHAFARMPHNIGLYLGLTGQAIGPADAYALGLATHCIGAGHFAAIEAGLADADPVDPILDGLHQDPGESKLLQLGPAIGRLFEAESVEAIIGRLNAERGPADAFAANAMSRLAKASPTALKITFRLIREAARLDLRGSLVRDYRLAVRALEGHDFAEGVRAHLVDKDVAPRWEPPSLDDVSTDMIDEIFTPLGDGELDLPNREQMQAARV